MPVELPPDDAEPVGSNFFVIIDQTDEVTCRRRNARVERMRLARHPLKQIVQMALETIHVRVHERMCTVAGRVVDDNHVDLEAIWPFGGVKAVERALEQRDAVETSAG